MSGAQLVLILEKLIELHDQLIDSGKLKTQAVKEGSMEALQQTMKEEQKLLTDLRKVEEGRRLIVGKIMSGKPFEGSEPVLSDCLNFVDDTTAGKLAALQKELISRIEELKGLNSMNQQLIQQSLQFVNFSLNIMMPQQPQINYEKPQPNKNPNTGGRSIFDSKA